MQALNNFRKRFLFSLNKLAQFYPELNQAISADSQFLTIGSAKLIPYK